MLACVSCCEVDFNESLSTLRYTQSARKIQNKAVINKDWGNSPRNFAIMRRKLSELQQIITNLRAELAQYKNGNNQDHLVNSKGMLSSTLSSSNMDILQNEIFELRNESENQKNEIDELQFMVEQLQERIKELSTQLLKAEAERDSLLLENLKKNKVNKNEINEEGGKNENNNDEKENDNAKKDSQNVLEEKEKQDDKKNIKENNLEKMNDTLHDNDNGDDDELIIEQNPIVVQYLKTISELKEKCFKAEDQLKYYKSIYQQGSHQKKIVRNRPFFEASKSKNLEKQEIIEGINDLKIEELIKRAKNEITKQLKEDLNEGNNKSNSNKNVINKIYNFIIFMMLNFN